MPRYDDRRGSTRLYVGHLSSRTRSRDLEDVFSRYGRVRDVDMKREFAFVEFSDPRDADDARYSLNGRDVDGSRIVVEFAKGGPRGSGGSHDYLGRGPAPGSGRCFNCGTDGHWARDCKAGDWKNKCYRCGDCGHIEKNCQNSPKKLKRSQSYSQTPSPRRGRSRSRSYSRSCSYSRSRSPPKERAIERAERSRSPKRHRSSPPPTKGRKQSPSPDERSPLDRGTRKERAIERAERRSRSPKRHRSSPPPTKGRKHSSSPDESSPLERGTPSPRNKKQANGSEYRGRPKARSRSPIDDAGRDSPKSRSPTEENGRSHSPIPRDDRKHY